MFLCVYLLSVTEEIFAAGRTSTQHSLPCWVPGKARDPLMQPGWLLPTFHDLFG